MTMNTSKSIISKKHLIAIAVVLALGVGAGAFILQGGGKPKAAAAEGDGHGHGGHTEAKEHGDGEHHGKGGERATTMTRAMRTASTTKRAKPRVPMAAPFSRKAISVWKHCCRKMVASLGCESGCSIKTRPYP